MEYPFAVHFLCHAVWGACWATTTSGQLLTLPVLAVVLANLCHMVGASVLNAALDIDADSRNPHKRDVAGAATRLGWRLLLGLGVSELALALAIAGVVSISLARFPIYAWTAAIVILHVLYNVEPVRLKRRGLANPLALGLTYATLPAVPAYFAVRPHMAPWMWLGLFGMLLLTTGRNLWWSIPDRDADMSVNDMTAAVRLGVFRSLAVACALTALGTVLIGASLWWQWGPLWALSGVLASSAFLIVNLRQLRNASGGPQLNARRMRRRDLPSALVADVVLALIPLVAATS
jgi:4-hydroxybenzoate polyprenyltransferase